ncbi:MAG: threonylcarbamoyl-AMP synthase [Candidatus Bathyarchaeota archaeon]|nr:MAG: threonylcarbamoyl-AMP synthase [Candidatus Bathyarchaeota archaeon]
MRVLTATLPNIRDAAEIVKRGGLVIFPTDTVYGLGCDPFNAESVEKLIRVKGDRQSPLPVLANSMQDVKRVAMVSKVAMNLAKRFWPGALTMVLPKRSKGLSSVVTFGLMSVGIRIPDHEVALDLARLCGGLIVGTSANKSGNKAATNIESAIAQLGAEVDVILDGGVSKFGISSTVVDLTSKEPKVLREGAVSIKEILDIQPNQRK